MGGEGGNQWVFDECDVNIWSVFYGAAENNIGRLDALNLILNQHFISLYIKVFGKNLDKGDFLMS